LVWGWIVPQIFASAVEQGVLPASLTIVQALKLSILFSILGLTGATASSKSKKSSDVGFVGNIVISVVAAIVLLPFWAILVMISGFFISLVWGWVIQPAAWYSAVLACGWVEYPVQRSWPQQPSRQQLRLTNLYINSQEATKVDGDPVIGQQNHDKW